MCSSLRMAIALSSDPFGMVRVVIQRWFVQCFLQTCPQDASAVGRFTKFFSVSLPANKVSDFSLCDRTEDKQRSARI